MEKYIELASKNILKSIGYPDEQLELLGKSLTLKEDSNLVKYVKIGYSNHYLGSQRILLIGNQQSLDVDIALQPNLRVKTHSELENEIKEMLVKHEINPKELYGFCHHSYGLDFEPLNIHFSLGFRS